jgi:ankyrin repeat protein
VGRGADLNGRNVLGLTPLESAVDQGRNAIAFFLLSARGPGPSSAPPPPPLPGAAGPGTTGRAAPPPRPARAPLSTPPAVAPRGTATPLPRADGGAARPDVGFLGFDAGRGG